MGWATTVLWRWRGAVVYVKIMDGRHQPSIKAFTTPWIDWWKMSCCLCCENTRCLSSHIILWQQACLLGKHAGTDEVLPGRFKDNPNYLPRFYTQPNFDALAAIRSACEAAKISMVGATYSWLLQHSALSAEKGDGILLGASTMSQLEENLMACQQPMLLPEPVLMAFDAAWPKVLQSGDVFPYWRSYSKDQPGRESLPPGAAYSAKKWGSQLSCWCAGE